MIKEEIYDKHRKNFSEYGNMKRMSSAAMDEYAVQQSIAFAEWITSNEYEYNQVGKFWEFYDSNGAGRYGLKFLCNTTEELYNLFLNSPTI